MGSRRRLTDTTPPSDGRAPDWEREAAFEEWRGQDPRRFSVMARQGFYAGWTLARQTKGGTGE